MARRVAWSAVAAVVAILVGAAVARAQPSGETPPPLRPSEPSLVGRTPSGSRVVVPLRHTDVVIDVRGLVAAATVTQRYVNDSAEPLEAVYVFPLPNEAAVYDLEMTIGDRRIKSVIQERAEAQRTYEAARVEGKRAALVDQERPNIFTTSVANLMPGDTVDVKLRYVEALRAEGPLVRLVFPMVVGPRYIPETGVEQAARVVTPLRTPETRAGHDIALRVTLDAGTALAEVRSPTHPVTVDELQDGARLVRLRSETTLPNRDFVLEYRTAARARPEAALFLSRDETSGGAHALVVAFPPDADEAARPPMERLFVVDVSGSMSGTSIEQARSALLQALDRLAGGDRFAIVAFSDRFATFRPTPVDATPSNLDAARGFVRGLEANGGTEMLPALRHAMAMSAAEGFVRQVVLLTDGCLGNEDQIFSALENELGDARLFTVAIGSAPNHHLATRMAEYGRGDFTHIADTSEVAARMGALLDRLEKPALTDLHLLPVGTTLSDVFPSRIPDLFPGRPLVVYGRVPADARGTLRLTGRQAGAELALEMPFDAARAGFHPGITTLWARQKAAETLDAWRRAEDEAEKKDLRQRVIDDAIAYRLVTKFTSLVAVEERIVNPGGDARTAMVPTELPHGWDHEQWFGSMPTSGTADLFLETAALVLMAGGLLLAWARTRRPGARA